MWSSATGLPRWIGTVVVAVVVAGAVAGGGMRSITIVQAVQYWLKLTAIAVPACVLLALWGLQGAPASQAPSGWAVPSSDPADLYGTYSLLLAPCCWARWGCPTCSRASTPTPTAPTPAGPPAR